MSEKRIKASKKKISKMLLTMRFAELSDQHTEFNKLTEQKADRAAVFRLLKWFRERARTLHIENDRPDSTILYTQKVSEYEDLIWQKMYNWSDYAEIRRYFTEHIMPSDIWLSAPVAKRTIKGQCDLILDMPQHLDAMAKGSNWYSGCVIEDNNRCTQVFMSSIDNKLIATGDGFIIGTATRITKDTDTTDELYSWKWGVNLSKGIRQMEYREFLLDAIKPIMLDFVIEDETERIDRSQLIANLACIASFLGCDYISDIDSMPVTTVSFARNVRAIIPTMPVDPIFQKTARILIDPHSKKASRDKTDKPKIPNKDLKPILDSVIREMNCKTKHNLITIQKNNATFVVDRKNAEMVKKIVKM